MDEPTDAPEDGPDAEAELAAFEEGMERLREELPYPQFNPSCVPVQIDDNTFHVRGGPWSGPILTIRDRDGDGVLTTLVDLIDGETPVEDIVASFKGERQPEVVEALVSLRKNDAIHDASAYEADAHYNHTAMRPFEVDDADRDRSRGLGGKSASVLVITDDTLGTAIAEDLFEAGTSDLTVHPLESDVATDLPAGVDRHPSESIDDAVSAADFVVLATGTERPAIAEELNRVAHSTRTPWTSVYAVGYDGLVGPTIFPGETACYQCLTHRVNSNVARPEFYESYREGLASDAPGSGPEPSHPAFRRTLAGIATLDIEHVLEYGAGFTAGRLVTMSAVDLSLSADRVLKVPRCDVCGKSAGEETSPLVTLGDLRDASGHTQRD